MNRVLRECCAPSESDRGAIGRVAAALYTLSTPGRHDESTVEPFPAD